MNKNLSFLLLLLFLSSQLAYSQDVISYQREACEKRTPEEQEQIKDVCALVTGRSSEHFRDNYANQKLACEAKFPADDPKVYVVDTVPMKCEDIPETVTYCTERSRYLWDEECLTPGEGKEVCAHVKKNYCSNGVSAFTIKTGCAACLNNNIDYYTPGPCKFEDIYFDQDCAKNIYYGRIDYVADQRPVSPKPQGECYDSFPICGIKFPAKCEDGESKNGVCFQKLDNMMCNTFNPDVSSWINVPCEAIPKDFSYCPSPQPKDFATSCKDDGKPVCAHYRKCNAYKQLARTYYTQCEACMDPNVDYVVSGICTEEEAKIIDQYECPGFANEEPQACNTDSSQWGQYCLQYYDSKCANGKAAVTINNYCQLNNFHLNNQYADYLQINGWQLHDNYHCKMEGCTDECYNKYEGEVCGVPYLWDCPAGEWCGGKQYETFCDAALDEKVAEVFPGKCCDNEKDFVCVTYKTQACANGFAMRTKNNTCQALQNAENLVYLDIKQGECPKDAFYGTTCLDEIPKCEVKEEPVCARFSTDDCDHYQQTYPNRCAALMDGAVWVEDSECYFEGCIMNSYKECSEQIQAPLCGYSAETKLYYKFDNYCEFYYKQKEVENLERTICPEFSN